MATPTEIGNFQLFLVNAMEYNLKLKMVPIARNFHLKFYLSCNGPLKILVKRFSMATLVVELTIYVHHTYVPVSITSLINKIFLQRIL